MKISDWALVIGLILVIVCSIVGIYRLTVGHEEPTVVIDGDKIMYAVAADGCIDGISFPTTIHREKKAMELAQLYGMFCKRTSVSAVFYLGDVPVFDFKEAE